MPSLTLPHHSIPVFGALGNHPEDLEPYQLLTLELCAANPAWVCHSATTWTCLEDKIPGCGLITSSPELSHGQDKQKAGRVNTSRTSPEHTKCCRTARMLIACSSTTWGLVL